MEKGGRRRTAGRGRGGAWAKKDRECRGPGEGLGKGRAMWEKARACGLQGPAGAAAAGGGRGVRQAGERESRRGEGGPQGAPAQPEPAAGGRRNRRRRFALRAVSPDGAAARNGLLRRKWQDWKVKGMFTSLYGKNVLQYIIGKLPEKITPPRAGSKEHRL